ncbi:transcription repressor OFP8-like [Magnolia sinica]|uniref:transcription repressor OFP8-like n=1 Tax=Magnolia sinica TaxID=86752 RepID=UPI00265A2879|nr:transcription repressor OFP8-like [Magnolia sinica]
MSPPAKKKPLLFSLACGCRDSKSVSVTIPDTPPKPRNPKPVTHFPSLSSVDTPTSSSWEAKDDDCSFSGESSSSFSGLLRQLNELEQNVLAWGCQIPAGPRHARSRSEGGKVGESVAVVKDSADPFADFRRSMLQMIVQKEIVGAEDLKELLRRFLALNSREHHDVIIRAFTEIWNDVFKGYQNTPDFLVNAQA